MGIQFQLTGRPNKIRKGKYNEVTVYLLDFIDVSKTAPPKDLPNPGSVRVTVVMNEKQWNRLAKAVQGAGDEITSLHRLLVKGECIMTLSKEICRGDVGVVAFEVQYMPRKEGEQLGEIISMDFTHNVPSGREKENENRADVTMEQKELHEKYDGVCQTCGQRCDVRVVETQGDIMVCGDCAANRTKKAVQLPFEMLQHFMNKTGWDEGKSREYLQSFPSRYALIATGDRYRWYWSWEKNGPLLKMNVLGNGTVQRMEYRDGDVAVRTPKQKTVQSKTVVQKDRKPKAKQQIAKPQMIRKGKPSNVVRVGERSYQKVKDIEVALATVHIPAPFRKANPREEKVQERMAYYKKHGAFLSPLIVLEKEGRFLLVDGYATFVAASRLTLKSCKGQIVKPPLHTERKVRASGKAKSNR